MTNKELTIMVLIILVIMLFLTVTNILMLHQINKFEKSQIQFDDSTIQSLQGLTNILGSIPPSMFSN